MKKPQGHLGQKIERKAVKLTHTSYTMPVEYRESIIKEIQADTELNRAKIEFDEESIYLNFMSLGIVGCEMLINLCRKNSALFIFNQSATHIKIEIFRPLATKQLFKDLKENA